MTYTGESRLKGKSDISHHIVDYWLTTNSLRVAERNGLHDWRIPPGVAKAYIDFGKMTGLNSDLLVAQAAKETAFFTSKIFRDKLNPAGLGAENDAPYDKAITFKTVEEGIRAQYAHMLSYVEGDDHVLQEYSVRHEILRDNRYLGVVKRLKDLNQRWAWTPPKEYEQIPDHLRYGQSIATWANGLVKLDESFRDIKDGFPISDIELPYHKDIGHRVKESGPFADYYRWLISEVGMTEALLLIGFPITDEFKIDEVKMQYFERARMEHHPGARPDKFDVLLGHLGREQVQMEGETKDRLEVLEKIQKYLKKLR